MSFSGSLKMAATRLLEFIPWIPSTESINNRYKGRIVGIAGIKAYLHGEPAVMSTEDWFSNKGKSKEASKEGYFSFISLYIKKKKS
jgi:hypothetical protein